MCECLDRGDGTAHVDECCYADWKAWREHGAELMNAAEDVIGYSICPLGGNLCSDPTCPRCAGKGHTAIVCFQPDKYAPPLAAALKKFGR